MRKRPLLVAAGGLLWLLAVAAGLGVMLEYENAPGVAAVPPDRWPGKSDIERSRDHATLVMLLHPRCPCSRASVEELDRLMARSHGQLTAHALFLRPGDLAEKWEQTDLWASAAAIPGVHVRRDDDGIEARRFGAGTSGQTLLYDADGRLLFSGGITPSRGHAGDNPGLAAILSLLAKGTSEHRRTPVFGCSLVDPGAADSRLGASRAD